LPALRRVLLVFFHLVLIQEISYMEKNTEMLI